MLEAITIETIEAIMNALPIDITFVDETGTIKYYSKADSNEGTIFPQSPEDIGEKVQVCHKQENVPKVNRILTELESNKLKVVDRWVDKDGRKLYISYRAVRDKTGKYLGAICLTEDMTELLKISTNKGGKQ